MLSPLRIPRFRAALLAFLLLPFAAPVRAIDLPPLRPQAPPFFTADLAISIDSTGAPGISVSITVPYSELSWDRIPGGYGAHVEFTAVFEPRRGPGKGGAWERRIFVDRFERTRSSVAVTERRTYSLPPGRYDARIELQDLGSEQISRVRQQFVVPDYSREPIGFADLELGVIDDAGAFVPVTTRLYGRNADRLAARATVFDRRSGDWPRTYPLRYRILDESGQEVLAGTRSLPVTRSAEPIVVRPDSTPLFLGRYTLEVALEEGKSRWRVERSFEVEESGPPRGAEFDRMLEPLSFIATADEIDALRSMADENQAAGWEAFWRRRDPTPDTPRNEAMLEFFRRVRFVNQNYQHFGPGWRSDMGRIYIKFGPPDQTETRQATTQSPQVEVWYYNQPYRRFVFVDREGFGRFVLLQPAVE